MNSVKSIKVNFGRTIQNFVWAILAHIALHKWGVGGKGEGGGLFIACLSLLFLDLHGWQCRCELLSACYAKTCNPSANVFVFGDFNIHPKDWQTYSGGIDRPGIQNSKWDALFHCISHDYSFAYWDSLCNHLRDVLQEDIFKLCASAAASEFCQLFRLELMYLSSSYQVKPH